MHSKKDQDFPRIEKIELREFDLICPRGRAIGKSIRQIVYIM